MACLAIEGAMKSTPTAAMEIPLNFTPLDLVIQAEARMALYRLHILKQPADPKLEAWLLSIWKNVGNASGLHYFSSLLFQSLQCHYSLGLLEK